MNQQGVFLEWEECHCSVLPRMPTYLRYSAGHSLSRGHFSPFLYAERLFEDIWVSCLIWVVGFCVNYDIRSTPVSFVNERWRYVGVLNIQRHQCEEVFVKSEVVVNHTVHRPVCAAVTLLSEDVATVKIPFSPHTHPPTVLTPLFSSVSHTHTHC